MDFKNLFFSNLRKNLLFKFIILIFLFSIFHIPSNLYAQQNNLKFDRINIEQGLSQNSVRSIIQDKKGFMWFGTKDGLNKYDGYHFTVYRHQHKDINSLSDNYITSIYEDKDDILWIGTHDGGFNKFNRRTETFTHYKHNPNNPNSLSNNRIWAICEDKDGMLWIGTSGGLNKFDKEKEIFTHYQPDPNNPNSLSYKTVKAIYEDKDGILWIGTYSKGLDKFDKENETFTHYQSDPNNPNSLSNNRVWTICGDKNGILWIGTSGGLNKFDKEKEIFTHYKHNTNNFKSISSDVVFTIYEDNTRTLWIGTEKGLNKFDRKNNIFIRYSYNPNNPNSISHDNIRAIYEDSAGTLWVGTDVLGISKYNKIKQKFIHYKHEINQENYCLNSDFIRSIYEDKDGILWIGTYDKGLNKFDRKNQKFTYYMRSSNLNSLSSNRVHSILEDKDGIFWFGTRYGLDKFDKEKEIFTHYRQNTKNPNSISNNSVLSIHEDKAGILWIGTIVGLNKFDKENEIFTHYKHDPNNPNSLNHNNAQVIYEDKAGVMWIGTNGGGLSNFDKEKEIFTHYKHDPNNPSGLNHDKVQVIYESKSGVMWIGTPNGLSKFDREKGTFEHYTQEDGLPTNSIIGIVEDETACLWLSTYSKGISKFNPQTETFRNYDVNDGLQGNEFNFGAFYKNNLTGEIFFGGRNGLNTFYPKEIKDNPHVPPVVLTSFKKLNKEINFEKSILEIDKIELSYLDNFISFEFSALDFVFPEKNNYAYKMEGFDNDWIYSGTRHYASYTNLRGGDYVFKVIGSNNDGIWSKESDGISIAIIVHPPFWERWWFIPSTILFIALLLIAFFSRRIIRMKKYSGELEMQVSARTKELKVVNKELKNINRQLMNELEMARRVQENIIPNEITFPKINGFSFSSKYIAMERVGGDLYDVIQIEKNKYGFLIVDVSGHGVPAALITTMAKVSFNDYSKSGQFPSQICKNVNKDFMHLIGDLIYFITAYYGILDTKTGIFTYSNAGHHPAILYRNKTKEIIKLDSKGTIIGAYPFEINFESKSIKLEKGDRVLLFTDGVIEAKNNEKELYGYKRLMEFISTESHLSTKNFVDTLIKEVETFCEDRPQDDDRAILYFKFD